MRIAALAIVLALASCKKSADPVVARLVELTAQVERMPAAEAAWQPARVGDGFVIGSAVRTGAASAAKLRVGKRGKLEVEASSIVYFTRTPGAERSDLRVEAGIAELETGDERIGLGKAVLEPNTRVRIETRPEGTSLIVTVGRAMLDDTVIAAGEQLTLGPVGRLPEAARADAGVAAGREGMVAVVVRDKPARVTTSAGTSELAVGEHSLEPGTQINVPTGAHVEVSRGGGRAVTSGPAELRLGDETLVDVTSGAITLHGETADAIASVPGGSVTAKSGASTALAVGGKETAIDAQRATTGIASGRGTQSLSAGQSAVLTRTGEIVLAAPPPARTVVTIAAGESPTLHDRQAPTPVRVAFDQICPAGGSVEVAKDRAFKKIVARSGGVGGANVLVPAGSFQYRVRCAGARGASGTLRLAKDAGRTPLPKAAARTAVDIDGRDYTILYQNLLPELTLAWKTAPRAARYTFVINTGRGADRRIDSPRPTLKLAAGELREGSYNVWVEPMLGRRSEASQLVIEFDNAAQSASIDTVETTADKLRIKGTVIEGSTVSVNNAPVELDRHRRFTTELAPPQDGDGVGVRIVHPKAGIHYYVLRTGGS
jgi:hypothetical protein